MFSLVKMLLQPRLPTVTSWSRTATGTSLNRTRISRHSNQFVERAQAQSELQIANEVVAASVDGVKEAKDLAAAMTAKSAVAKAELDLMKSELAFRLAQIKLLAAIGQK